jgi:hypothetical protein
MFTSKHEEVFRRVVTSLVVEGVLGRVAPLRDPSLGINLFDCPLDVRQSNLPNYFRSVHAHHSNASAQSARVLKGILAGSPATTHDSMAIIYLPN